MFFSFMEELRTAGISASLKEHLALLAALEADVIRKSLQRHIHRIWTKSRRRPCRLVKSHRRKISVARRNGEDRKDGQLGRVNGDA